MQSAFSPPLPTTRHHILHHRCPRLTPPHQHQQQHCRPVVCRTTPVETQQPPQQAPQQDASQIVSQVLDQTANTGEAHVHSIEHAAVEPHAMPRCLHRDDNTPLHHHTNCATQMAASACLSSSGSRSTACWHSWAQQDGSSSRGR